MESFLTGIILFILTASLMVYFTLKDRKNSKKVVKLSLKIFFKNSIRMFSIFIIIGILQSFLSKENVSHFLLRFSGIKGILTGIFFGGIMMGPVATGYPIAAYILKNGGSISLVSAFLTSWVFIGIISISMEFRFLGKRFALLRNLFSIITIILISIIMEIIL